MKHAVIGDNGEQGTTVEADLPEASDNAAQDAIGVFELEQHALQSLQREARDRRPKPLTIPNASRRRLVAFPAGHVLVGVWGSSTWRTSSDPPLELRRRQRKLGLLVRRGGESARRFLELGGDPVPRLSGNESAVKKLTLSGERQPRLQLSGAGQMRCGQR